MGWGNATTSQENAVTPSGDRVHIFSHTHQRTPQGTNTGGEGTLTALKYSPDVCVKSTRTEPWQARAEAARSGARIKETKHQAKRRRLTNFLLSGFVLGPSRCPAPSEYRYAVVLNGGGFPFVGLLCCGPMIWKEGRTCSRWGKGRTRGGRSGTTIVFNKRALCAAAH